MGNLQQDVLNLLHPSGQHSPEPPELAYRASYWDELLQYTEQWNCQLAVLYRLQARLETPEWQSVVPERTLALLSKKTADLQKTLDQTLEFGRQTLDVLRSVRVPALVFKGADLALRCYPEKYLRPIKDVDLMIPRELLAPALRELGRAGYRRLDSQLGHRLPLGHSDSEAKVVLYSKIFDGDAESDSAEIWDRARSQVERGGKHPLDPVSGHLLYPCSEDGLVVLFQAMVESVGPSSPLFLTDLHYWIMQEKGLDWDRLLFLLHRRKLEASGWFFLSWIHNEYNTDIPESVLSVLSRRVSAKRDQANRWSQVDHLFPANPQGSNYRTDFVRFLTSGRTAPLLRRINPVRWLKAG